MYQFLYQIFSTPFGYVMRLIYQFVGSYGVSIFLFALLVKVLMLPLSFKTKRSMMEVSASSPRSCRSRRPMPGISGGCRRNSRTSMTRKGSPPWRAAAPS